MAWLDGYNYRKSVTLSRASGAVNNYQMKLLVGESSGAVGESVDCGGKCLPTFNDLRFTNSDGTLLEYWIESISGITPNQLATVWIEFDSIGTGDATFYMYYGKKKIQSTSNGSNTFPFFYDFGGVSSTVEIPVAVDVNKYEAWTSIAKDTSGNLYIVYRTSNTNAHIFDATGKIVMRKSTDDGCTWGSETVVVDTPDLDDRNASLLIFDNDGVQTWLVSYNVWDNSVALEYVIKSTDGVNWGTPILVKPTVERAVVSNPILLSNGAICIASYNETTWTVYIEKSTDGGDTWSEITVGTDATRKIDESTIIEIKSGGSYTGGMCLISRCEASPYTYRSCFSTDYGATWGAFSDVSGLPNPTAPNPVSLIRLSDGYIYLTFTTENTVKIYKSTNECASFSIARNGRVGGSGEVRHYSQLIETSSGYAVVTCTNEALSSDVYVSLFSEISLGTTLDSDVWDTIGTPTISMQCGILDITQSANTRGIRTKTAQFGLNYALRCKHRPYELASGKGMTSLGFGVYNETLTNWIGSTINSSASKNIFVGCSIASGRDSYVLNDSLNYKIQEFQWLSGNVKAFQNDIQQGSDFTSHVPSVDLKLSIGTSTFVKWTTTARSLIDFILVRNLLAVEPAWGAWGDEEEDVIPSLPPVSITVTTLACDAFASSFRANASISPSIYAVDTVGFVYYNASNPDPLRIAQRTGDFTGSSLFSEVISAGVGPNSSYVVRAFIKYDGVTYYGDPVSVSTIVISEIEVTPILPELQIGETVQLTVTATYTNGTTVDITSYAGYSSQDLVTFTPVYGEENTFIIDYSTGDTIATVSGGGLVTGISGGVAKIYIYVSGFKYTVSFTVVQPAEGEVDVGGIWDGGLAPGAIIPNVIGIELIIDSSMYVTLSQQALLYGEYDDSPSTTSLLNNADAVWSSSDTTVATIDANGLIVAIAVGVTFIKVSYTTEDSPEITYTSMAMLRVESQEGLVVEGQPYQYIPLSPDPNQSFRLTVAASEDKSVELDFNLRWNGETECWYMTLSDPVEQEYYVDDIPLLAGEQSMKNILKLYSYLDIGSCFIIDISGKGTGKPDLYNLGIDFVMIWGYTE